MAPKIFAFSFKQSIIYRDTLKLPLYDHDCCTIMTAWPIESSECLQWLELEIPSPHIIFSMHISTLWHCMVGANTHARLRKTVSFTVLRDSSIMHCWYTLEVWNKMLCFLHSLTHSLFFLHSIISYIRIDGRTSPEERMASVTRFQNRDDVQVAVLSITAANTGITLTAAQLVIFAELYWNPGVGTLHAGIFAVCY